VVEKKRIIFSLVLTSFQLKGNVKTHSDADDIYAETSRMLVQQINPPFKKFAVSLCKKHVISCI